MIYADGDLGWTKVVDEFRRSALRLEQAMIYPGDVHSGLMDDWLAGGVSPPPLNDWNRMVAAKIADGARMERVRVFEDPPSPYQTWNRWASHTHVVDVGEVQRYMSRPTADRLGITEHAGDWWLIDDQALVIYSFDKDRRMTVEVTGDPERVDEASRWWKVAIDNSEPWDYEAASALA